MRFKYSGSVFNPLDNRTAVSGPMARRPERGAYNRWGKHILFSFLNLDYAEKDE